MKTIVNSINVVNDTAKRFVGLMTQYSDELTKNEVEKQIVEDHRKRLNKTNKKILKIMKRMILVN